MRRALLAILVPFLIVGEIHAQRIPVRGLRPGIQETVVGAANPISASRMTTAWTTSGAGTIPARAVACATLGTAGQASSFAQSVSAATINAAIQSCTAGQHVKLNAGTYQMDDGITFAGKSNVTLRGAGSNSTLLKFASGVHNPDCGGAVAAIAGCPGGVGLNGNDSPQNACLWTAGYARGTTDITVGSCSGTSGQVTLTGSLANAAIGTPVVLDQESEGPPDPGGPYISGGNSAFNAFTCQTTGCARNVNRTYRAQSFYTWIEAINGSTITLHDPLVHQNWSGTKNPGIWFPGNGVVNPCIQNIGVEDLSVDVTGNDVIAAVYYGNNCGSWIKNIRGLSVSGGGLTIVRLYQSSHISVIDSYFYGKGGGSGNYGISLYGVSNVLVQNYIGHCNSTTVSDGTSATVIGHNYIVNVCYVNYNWMQPCHSFHATGNEYILLEANQCNGIQLDQIHGAAHFVTGYRNRWTGWENGKGVQTVPVHNYAWSRYMNWVGNVLGKPGFHDTYETNVGDTLTRCHRAIWAFGLGSNCDNSENINNRLVKTAEFTGTPTSTSATVSPATDWQIGDTLYILDSLFMGNNWQVDWGVTLTNVTGGGTVLTWTPATTSFGGGVYGFTPVVGEDRIRFVNPPNDPLVESTALRCGNFDVATGTVRWEASEAPSADGYFPNPACTNHNLLKSLYLGETAPSWYRGLPYPANGPEVTGGSEAGLGGRSYDNPAAACFAGLSIDTNYAVAKSVTAGSWQTGNGAIGGTVNRATLTIGAHSFAVGDSMSVQNVTATGGVGYNITTVLIMEVTGTTVTYGLLDDPGTYQSGGTVYSPDVRQFPGC